MAQPQYLMVLRRRWRVIVACFVLATVTGYILSPEKPAAPKGSGYRASVTLVPATTEESAQPNLYLAAHLATTPDVANLAAEELPADIRPKDDEAAITATVDPDVGALTVEATDLDKNSAVILAQAYGNATIQFVGTAAAGGREAALAAAQKELKAVEKSLKALEEERPFNPNVPIDPVLQARLDSEIARYGAIRQRVQDLLRAESGPAPLQVIGTPEITSLEGGVITAPSDRRARALLAGVLGLVLGLGVALAVDRLDRKLRERDEVEDAFGLPVLGEIPRISRRRRARHAVVAAARPDSAAAEAYRSLRSAITLVSHSTRNDAGAASALDAPQGQVLIVTAAHGREGKSTAVANLAVALAETDRSVIVIDCDFRKPDAHLFFGLSPDRGLTGMLDAGYEGDFDQILHYTAFSGVRLITCGRPVGHPASVLPHLAQVVAEARRRADVVLIDSSPLLVVSEAVDVLQYADAALVTCRLGRTTHEQAQRARLVLQRAEIPVLGVVVTGTRPPRGTPYGRPSRSRAMRTSLATWVAEVAAASRSATAGATRERTVDETSADVPELVARNESPDRYQDWRPEPGTAVWQEHQQDDQQPADRSPEDQQPADQPADQHEEDKSAHKRLYQRQYEQPAQSPDARNGTPDKPEELQYRRRHESGPPQEPKDESPDEPPEAWEEEALRSAG